MADFKTIARPYARAVFEIAARDQALDAWSRALRCAALLVENDTALRHLAQPSLADEERVAYIHLLTAGLDDAAVLKSPHGTNFLQHVANLCRLASTYHVIHA